MVEMVDKRICTGCKMCGDICAFGAITFATDSHGFWYPKVDSNKCKKCLLCIKKCPAINDEIKLNNTFEVPRIFAGWTKDTEIRLQSTSGGLFWEFAKSIIEQNGFVVGSVYSDDWKTAYHFVGKTIDDIIRLKGSKYFQSDTEGIYKEIKKCLQTGKKTLFVGSPCQIAALKSFLGQEYDNLFLMDFICRGINSPLAFKRFIEYLEEKYNSKTVFVQLKNKRTGWQSLGTFVKMENGSEYHQDKWHNDLWVKGFLNKNLYMRPSCHSCKYRNIPRGADLTIGDFWGVKGENEEEYFNGISSLMVNTQKGFDLLLKVCEKLCLKEKYLSDLTPGNPALHFNPPSASKKEKEKFFNKLEKEGFEVAIKSIKSGTYIKRIILLPFHAIKKIIRVLRLSIRFCKSFSVLKFIKYNFLCKNVLRDKKAFLLPHKNVVINIDKTAKLYIKNKSIILGFNLPKGSKYHTLLKMEKNSVWESNNGAQIFYGVNLELKPCSHFRTRFFSVNTGSTIIMAKEMEFGDDVMMGRNIIIYDSDFHQILNENGFISNPANKVTIEDHVWIVNNVVILKGVTIGKNSLISSFVIVKKDIPPHSVVSNGTKNNIHEFIGNWCRDSVK